MTGTNSKDNLLEGQYKNRITSLNNEVKHLLDMFDSPHDHCADGQEF